MRLECKVDRAYEGNTCLVSPGCGKWGLAILYVAVNVREGKVITQVANLSDSFVTLKEGYSIGSIEEIDEVIENDEMDNTIPPVRTCSEPSTSGNPGSGGNSSTTSGDTDTIPKTVDDDDPILESIFKKLPYKTLQ